MNLTIKITSPQHSGRRRRKRPPADETRGPRAPRRGLRHAGARPERPGGDCHGHFGHRSSKKRADGDLVQSKKNPRPRAKEQGRADQGAVLQGRGRWDHDEDIFGCGGGSIHQIGGREWEVGGALLLPPLPFVSPSPSLRLRRYICTLYHCPARALSLLFFRFSFLFHSLPLTSCLSRATLFCEKSGVLQCRNCGPGRRKTTGTDKLVGVGG
jgi:hypothetical protein